MCSFRKDDSGLHHMSGLTLILHNDWNEGRKLALIFQTTMGLGAVQIAELRKPADYKEI